MSRYKTTKMMRKSLLPKNKNSVLSYATTYYKDIPESNDDIFIVSQHGDRLDNLAFQFYKDPNLWWYIAQANNLSSINVEPGVNLRVPISTGFTQTG